MTETLQDKIDDIISTQRNENKIPYGSYKDEINKAIQELREEIKHRKRVITSFDLQRFDDGYNDALSDILSLIGEKK